MTEYHNGYRPRKDDILFDGMTRITVLRVSTAGRWADILVEQFATRARWTKRQPLPFPAGWDLPVDEAPPVTA